MIAMKYRQAKKIIKKDKVLSCWLNSNNDWVDAATNATMRTDELSTTCLKICGNFINWNWKQCLEKSHRYGIKSKHLKRYYWKIYERKQ